MESVITTILDILLTLKDWFILYLMANNSASVLVTWTAWWIIFINSLLNICIWVIDVATLFLILTSETMMAMEGDDEFSRTISSSSCLYDLSLFSFLQMLKEICSEKIVNNSMTRRKFWIKRSKRWKTFVRSVSHIYQVTFDKRLLSIRERVESDSIEIWLWIELRINERANKIARR